MSPASGGFLLWQVLTTFGSLRSITLGPEVAGPRRGWE
jgi:hypothetical protein